MSRPLTETQKRRAAYPYRDKYFQYNPGIFGCIWICSQCYKPIIGKKNVVIDHIIPLAKGGRNHVSNCTACCRKCNSAKSDIIDHRVIKGKVFKIFESNAYRTQRGACALIALTASLALFTVRLPFTILSLRKNDILNGTAKGISGILKFTAFKVVPTAFNIFTFPLRRGTLVSRLYFLALYAIVIFFLLQEKTNLLNAWIT